MTVEKIYTENHQEVFNYVLSMVKNHHDAQEVTNDVFIKMFRLDSACYDEKHGTALVSWIRTISNSVIIDFFRTNHQDHYQAVSDFADGEDPNKSYFDFIASKRQDADALVLKTELLQQIDKAFQKLNPRHRRIANLFFIKDLPYNEIAEIMNVPMGTVKGMINRSRTILQDALKGCYELKQVNVQ